MSDSTFIDWECGCRTMKEGREVYAQLCRKFGCEIEPVLRYEVERRGIKLVVIRSFALRMKKK